MSAVYQLELYDVDGSTSLGDVTTYAFDKKGAYRLNRPVQWTFRINTANVTGLKKGCRLRVRRNGSIVFNGIVMFIERAGDKQNSAWATVTALDPMCWYAMRVVRDETGDFSRPLFTAPLTFPNVPTYRPISGAEILQRTIRQSQLNTDPADITSDIPYSSSQYSEGTMWVDTVSGSFDTSCPPAIDLGTDDLTSWPITIQEMVSLLVNTGACDIYHTPVDGADPMVVLNVVNQKGSDVSGTVHFDYATGAYSLDALKYTEDLATLANKLWYYLGPPEGVQRYKTNITLSRMDMADPPQSAIKAAAIMSRLLYGVAMQVRIYDSGNESTLLSMYETLWQVESILRMNGQEMAIATPIGDAPFLPFDNFNLGDVVTINAGAAFGSSFSAQQRIYGFDVMPDANGTERLGDLIASADAE